MSTIAKNCYTIFKTFPIQVYDYLKTWFCKETTRYGPKWLLFDQEAIEAYADTHCHNFFSGKDITLKTTQPFFKSYCELHLTFWSFFVNVRFLLLFNQEAIEIWADAHCQNCLSGKCITLKTTRMNYIQQEVFIWTSKFLCQIIS